MSGLLRMAVPTVVVLVNGTGLVRCDHTAIDDARLLGHRLPTR